MNWKEVFKFSNSKLVIGVILLIVSLWIIFSTGSCPELVPNQSPKNVHELYCFNAFFELLVNLISLLSLIYIITLFYNRSKK